MTTIKCKPEDDPIRIIKSYAPIKRITTLEIVEGLRFLYMELERLDQKIKELENNER